MLCLMRGCEQHDATRVLCDFRERGGKCVCRRRPDEEHRVDITKRAFQRLGRGQIATHYGDLGWQPGRIRMARQRANLRACAEELGNDLAADGAGGARDDDSLDHAQCLHEHYA